ncbi:YdcH family protein [Roseisalinus antarcticus]|uniref:DUF465 domain-containing protein n=1 Tax=Roseisalinus antarcticus TaxID=254357 RepID=A0A1Y5SSB6_9RHOB|nr:YdcH family protein [Roseisalinus antarcticus]SLN47216.1 hypothetical protein ROA7023_01970 [Roseisalinus antarcticus]
MSHTPHELSEDFPGQAEAIHALKSRDTHFAHLVDSYHEVNRAVHRAETDVEPASDARITDLRKQRMRLKDEIASALSEA